jgi:signal transduction histidine kinase
MVLDMTILKNTLTRSMVREQIEADGPMMAHELFQVVRTEIDRNASLSHELRSPLVTGIGYIELLLEGAYGPLSSRAEERMTIALKNLRRLSRRIESLLERGAGEANPPDSLSCKGP